MKFDTEKTVSYWAAGAEYDFDTAKKLFKARRYPYTLFFGHLAVEKILKALVVQETQEHAPHTHSLPLLASKLAFKIPEEIETNLAVFMEFYFEARYPEDQLKFYRKCTRIFTEKNLKKIKEAYQWLKKKL